MTSSARPTVCYVSAKTFSPCRGPAHTAALTAEAIVIDYETYARIRDCRDRQGLTITQIASTLRLHRQTVAKWLARPRFERPRPSKRSSILDPFKGRITRLLDTH